MKVVTRLFAVLPPLSSLGVNAYLKRATAERVLLNYRELFGRSTREVVEFVRVTPAKKRVKKKTASSRIRVKKATRK